MRKNRRKRRSLQEIKILIDELESTGLSGADLARREGVSVGAVYLWKRKVREIHEIGEPIEMILSDPAQNVPLQAATNHSGLTLTFGNWIGCKIDPGFDAETLLHVIETINQARGQIPC
ncbi:MAG: hypothetical protein HC806_09715 [Anaerolineae bacterium]|nr:hypothetical protein [Anaerolineae bacterium]